MKKSEKVIDYLNKIFHFVNAILCTWGMAVLFMLIPFFSFFKWQSVAPLIQVFILLLGFKGLGWVCGVVDHKKDNNEGKCSKDVFNRNEFHLMILTSTVTVIIMFCELKQYFRNDGGVTLTLLMSTIAVVIGALISPEELFYGKRIRDAVKGIFSFLDKDSVSNLVCSGAAVAGLVLSLIGYFYPRHNEPGTELSNTRTLIITILLGIIALALIIYTTIKNKSSKKSD